jgi:hypothetical protein
LNPTLKAALEWHDRGITAIPIVAHTKRPAIKWKHLQGVLPPRALVKRWFSIERNIALLCGESLTVLDFDNLPKYHIWRKDHALDTYTVKTRRGYHAYLKLDNPPASSFHVAGCDVKASGYVLTAPSIHPSGAQYRVVNASSILSVFSLDQVGIIRPDPPPMPISEIAHYEGMGDGLVSRIKRELPIVDVLREMGSEPERQSRDGAWLMVCCPFHDDHTPSMWVNTQLGICRCYNQACDGSRKPMDVINLYALHNRMGNRLAIFRLASRLQL